MTVRDAATLLETKVRETLTALDLTEADTAAAALAVRYAAIIDDADTCDNPECKPWAAVKIMPLLLLTLESLGATPLARSKLKRGDTPDAKPGQLAQLRAARTKGAARPHRA